MMLGNGQEMKNQEKYRSAVDGEDYVGALLGKY